MEILNTAKEKRIIEFSQEELTLLCHCLGEQRYEVVDSFDSQTLYANLMMAIEMCQDKKEDDVKPPISNTDYVVMEQVEEINDTIWNLSLLNDETMEDPTTDELQTAAKQAISCMHLMVRILCSRHMTMRDLYNELREKQK